MPIRLPPKSPNLTRMPNGLFGRSRRNVSRVWSRWVRATRASSRGHLEHYHCERNHQGLDNRLLQHAPPPKRRATNVQRRDRLGGLLNFYYREAV